MSLPSDKFLCFGSFVWHLNYIVGVNNATAYCIHASFPFSQNSQKTIQFCAFLSIKGLREVQETSQNQFVQKRIIN